MGSDDLWKRKIKAFLYTPPHRALAADSDTARQWAAQVVQAALGDDSLDEVKEADQIAKGLDIPPFVEQVSAGIFQQDPCLTHPLSGELYRLKDLQGRRLPSLDSTMLQACVVEAVKAIRQEIVASQSGRPDSLEKRLFLALWRKLPEIIQKKERGLIQDQEQRLGSHWDLLPADPRIPSHSIWDHAAVASAVAGALPEPALLIFDLASVQEFVATARRTQDAWMGSFLPSYLIWEAMKVIVEECGPDCVVYPSLREQPFVDLWLYKKGIEARGDAANTEEFLRKYQPALQIASFPERFTAIVPAANAQALAEKAHKVLLERWKAIAWAVKCEVEAAVALEMDLPLAGDPDWKDAWDRQIDDCFSRLGIFWVVCPWRKETGTDEASARAVIETHQQLFPTAWESSGKQKRLPGFSEVVEAIQERGGSLNTGMVYPLLSRMAAQALTARKTLRDFRQVKEPDWKCSLCGLRQALRPGYTKLREIFGEEGDERLLRLFWERLATVSRHGAGLKLQGRIRRGDRLCAVCLVKRLALEAYFETALGFDHHLFPSTATIATAPFKAKVIDQYIEGKFVAELKNYVQAIQRFLEQPGASRRSIFYRSSAVPKLERMKNKINGQDQQMIETFLRIDGEWLFEESFDPEKLQREYQVDKARLNEPACQSAVRALQDLLKATKQADIRPSRYYAIIAMDGDKMSEWVAGIQAPSLLWLFHPEARSAVRSVLSNADQIRRPLGPTLHLALSTALKNFAVELVRTVVEEEHLGKLIYAGGDDVLAFVPVSDLLPVMRKLRRLFQGEDYTKYPIRVGQKTIQAEKGFARITVDDKEDHRLLAGAFRRPGLLEKPWQGPTASLGAVIVHESHPLASAIEQARTAMKAHAKDGLDRDAFAIHLLKRAGEPLEVGMKWYVRTEDQPGLSVDILEHVEGVVGFLRSGTLSSRLAYDMKEKQAGLAGDLQDLKSKANPWWLEAQAKDLERLIDRHLKRGMERKSKEEARNRIMDLFKVIRQGITAEVMKPPLEKPLPKGLEDPWQVVTRLLLVARFIAEEGEDVALH